MVRLGTVAAALGGGIGLFAISLIPLHSAAPAPSFPDPRADAKLTFENAADERAFRIASLKSARVWRPTDPATIDLGVNPRDETGLLSADVVSCRLQPKESSGTTPKFRCVLSNGEVIKVKYGRAVREIHAEVAAARLLSALGFAADEMHLVPRLLCFGCPRFPFRAIWALDWVRARSLVDALPADRYSEFAWVSVERPFPGIEVTAGDDEGWRWDELPAVDERAGGASRAELDALRLMAAFLVHWDNKAANQRLVCQGPADDRPVPTCGQSVAFIQDLGATFGPNKVDLKSWDATPIWADRTACVVSMNGLPYAGATFTPVQVSEEGRRLLASQLARVSQAQVEALFTAARFPHPDGAGPSEAAKAWAAAFARKARAITEGPACPPLAPL